MHIKQIHKIRICYNVFFFATIFAHAPIVGQAPIVFQAPVGKLQCLLRFILPNCWFIKLYFIHAGKILQNYSVYLYVVIIFYFYVHCTYSITRKVNKWFILMLVFLFSVADKALNKKTCWRMGSLYYSSLMSLIGNVGR